MQPLTVASNRGVRAARPGSGFEGAVEGCSAAVLAHVPPVMWFIRKRVNRKKATSVPVPHYRVLCVVSRAPGSSVSDVAENLAMSLPMVSRIVTKLAERGLLKIVSCEDDRRRKRLAITRSGLNVVDASQEQLRSAIAEKLEGLSAAECRRVTEALELLGGVFMPATAGAESSE